MEYKKTLIIEFLEELTKIKEGVRSRNFMFYSDFVKKDKYRKMKFKLLNQKEYYLKFRNYALGYGITVEICGNDIRFTFID